MIYDDPMSTEPLPNTPQKAKQDPDKLAALKRHDELRGIFKQSGMTEELIRDRREEHRKEEEKQR
jgi:hypothetical protein